MPLEIDYLGFSIEDRFVIGYGLDFQGQFRNMPFIGVNIGEGAPLSTTISSVDTNS